MKKIIFIFAALIALTGCDGLFSSVAGVEKKSIGNPYEILLVCDDAIWETPAGTAIAEAVTKSIPGLPLPEPSFKVTRISKDKFEGVKKTFRNIIIVDINGQYYSQASMKYARNVNAVPQVALRIQAPSIEEFESYVKDNSQSIIDFFTLIEFDRQQEILKDNYNKQAQEMINKEFGCDMKIPLGIAGYKVGENCIWFSDHNTTNRDILNFVIYSYPYTSTDNFSKENFSNMRDSVLRKNVSEHMTTRRKDLSVREEDFNGHYMKSVRGLWEMDNEPWGGAFVSYSVVDEINNRMIVVETFTSIENKDKGNIMRRLEASLRTLRLPEDKLADNANTLPEIIVEEK